MDYKYLPLKVCRKIYRALWQPTFAPEKYDLDRESSNEKIIKLLQSDMPCMISRFGTGEIGIVNNYLTVHSNVHLLKRCFQFITDETGLPWWDELFFKSMHNNAGIFPTTIETLNKFSERYLQDIPEIDLLGSLNYAEKHMPLKESCCKVHIECLYPFWVNNPWTQVLKDKKVLVIHPFVRSIQSQYERKGKIFDNPNIWPNYEMQLIQAVQSNAGNKVPYKDWFEALEFMEKEIAKIDFDISIIGCGAYGLPLAAFIKRLGKKSIHLGGGSQLLFGIKGRRWEQDYKYSWLPDDFNTNYSTLFNEHWVRPSQDETPTSANKVENACYW